MPCSAFGRATLGSISPPSSSIRASVASKTRRDPGVERRPRPSSLGTPKRRPLRSSRLGATMPPSIPTEVESQGSRPSIAAEQQRRVGDVAGQRPALVERGGEGDHPVARDRPVGRLQPDDPAERGGLADRAAGVGADRSRARDRRRPRPPSRRRSRRGRGRGPTGSAPARRRSSRSRSPSRTRPCWSCRARGRRRRRGGAPRSRCRADGSPRGSCEPAVVGVPSVAKMSLTAIGIPASGPSWRAVVGAALGPPEIGVQLVARRRARSRPRRYSSAETSPRGDLRRRLGDGQLAAAPPSGVGLRRGDAEGAVGGVRRRGERRRPGAGSAAARRRAARSPARPRARSARPPRGRGCRSGRRARGCPRARRSSARPRPRTVAAAPAAPRAEPDRARSRPGF